MDGGRGSSPAHLFSKSASEAPSEASAAVGVERARHRQRPSLAPISMGFSLGRAGADGVLFRDVDVDADSLLEHLTHAARLVIVDNTIVHLAQHLELPALVVMRISRHFLRKSAVERARKWFGNRGDS